METACGWCQYRTQIREYLLKNCKRWKPQQKILWAKVRRDTGRGKNRFKIRDLLADERCTHSILDFLRTMRMGSRVGPRVALPKPSENRTEDGDAHEGTQGEERRYENGDVSRGEGEEVEDEKGTKDEEE